MLVLRKDADSCKGYGCVCRAAIEKVKSKKSPGINQIPAELI
jgi:hypothetical protein